MLSRILSPLLVLTLLSVSIAQATLPEPAQDYLNRLGSASQDLQEFQNQLKDKEKLKKTLGYYFLTPEDRADYEEMFQVMAFMTPAQWSLVWAEAQFKGYNLFLRSVNPSLEENRGLLTARRPHLSVSASTLPEDLKNNLTGFIETPTGIVFSKYVPQNSKEQRESSPLLLGGGFPFNQIQFQDFNAKVSKVSNVDFYDSLCTGLPVLYDEVLNEGKACRPYQPAGPTQLLIDEMAFRVAQTYLYGYAQVAFYSLTQIQNAVFRMTRLMVGGVTLVDQAYAIASITQARQYQKGQAIFTGISYGGLIGAKIGALFPGQFKALVLVSPGLDSPAHSRALRDVNAGLETSTIHHRVVRQLIKDTAFSPRYDAYRPICLNDYDLAFRNSLQAKMLGELDLNIFEDLKRVQDRVYMITGAKDASVPPLKQIAAMKVLFAKQPTTGSFILVPDGGHALWGNPAQSAETAVIRSLEEIQKGTAGFFQDGGVYLWNEGQKSFEVLGYGEKGLLAAETFIASLPPPAPPVPPKK